MALWWTATKSHMVVNILSRNHKKVIRAGIARLTFLCILLHERRGYGHDNNSPTDRTTRPVNERAKAQSVSPTDYRWQAALSFEGDTKWLIYRNESCERTSGGGRNCSQKSSQSRTARQQPTAFLLVGGLRVVAVSNESSRQEWRPNEHVEADAAFCRRNPLLVC